MMPEARRFNIVELRMVSPDNPIGFVQNDKMIAARALGKGIQLVDLQTGRAVRTVAPDSHYTACVASPDGKHIAAFTDTGEVRLIDTETWESLTVRRHRPPFFHDCSFADILWSPDSRRFFVEPDGRFRGRDAPLFVYDLAKPSIVEMENNVAFCVTFSADGDKFLAIGDPTGKGDCRVFSTRTGRLLGSLDLQYRKLRVQLLDGTLLRGRLMCVAFSPDGGFLASGGSDNLLKIWRVTWPEQPRGDMKPGGAK